MTMNLQRLPFFERVSKGPDYDLALIGTLCKTAERYWSFGSTKARVIVYNKNEYLVEHKNAKSNSWIVTVLKIVACITIIPVILLGIKLIYRATHLFYTEVKPVTDHDFHDLSNFDNSAPKERIEEQEPILAPCKAHENLSEEYSLEDSPLTKSDVPVKKMDLQELAEELQVIYPQGTQQELGDDLPLNSMVDRKCLSNYPVAYSKETDNLPIKEYFQQGELLYLQEKYEGALGNYLNYVLKSSRNNTWNVHGYSAIQKSMEIFKDIFKIQVQDLEDSNNVENNFFRSLAYVRDYHITSDAALIQDKISRPVSLVTAPPLNEILGQLSETIQRNIFKQGPYNVAVHELQGRRPTMEDTHLITSFSIEQKNKAAQEAYLFGVFDGHGGAKCARFICDNIAEQLKKILTNSLDLSDKTIFNSLKWSCVKTNDLWLDVVKKSQQNVSGSTGCMVLILGQTAWCINVGDSRAILSKNDELFQCSQDAKPNKEPFLTSILKRGGFVQYYNGWRLNGDVAVARAFGDCYQRGMTARPKITKWDLKDLKSGYFVIACDGMWDVLGGNNVQELSKLKIMGLGRSPTVEELPFYLGQIAYAKGSSDNITVMSINLSPKNIP